MERLERALTIIQSEMKERGGIFKLIQAPAKIGSSRDEIEDIKAKIKAKKLEKLKSITDDPKGLITDDSKKHESYIGTKFPKLLESKHIKVLL